MITSGFSGPEHDRRPNEGLGHSDSTNRPGKELSAAELERQEEQTNVQAELERACCELINHPCQEVRAAAVWSIGQRIIIDVDVSGTDGGIGTMEGDQPSPRVPLEHDSIPSAGVYSSLHKFERGTAALAKAAEDASVMV